METNKRSFVIAHEKLITLIFLIMVIVTLTLIAAFLPNPMKNDEASMLAFSSKLRILDATVGGLMALCGMAAQSLLRISSQDAALTKAIDKLPPPTGDAKTPEAPVDEAIPEYARES